MAKSPQSVLDELKKGIFRPLYFLQGDEPFYIDQIAHYIEENALTESERGFNQLIMYGKDHSIGNVVVQARRFPMMAQRQVVIVREAQDLTDIGRKEGQELLLKYIMDPVPTTVLVFAYKYKKLDGKTKLAKDMDKLATLVTSEKIKDYKLTEWLESYVRSRGLVANQQALQMLADHIGNDLSRIANELDKVQSQIKGTELTTQLIYEKIGVSKEFNAFEFQQALAQKNMKKALQIAQYFVANPKASNIIPNLALLFNYFVKLLLIQQAPSGISQQELAAKARIEPYLMKDYQAAARRFTVAQLRNIIHQIRLADGYSKGIDAGSRDTESIYKDLIFQIVKI